MINLESLLYIPYKEDNLFCARGGGGCGIRGRDLFNSV